MNKRLCYLPILFFLSLSHITLAPAWASQDNWTEEKVSRAAIKASKAATQKKWSRAIKYGEQILRGSKALYQQNDIKFINRLNTVNSYYEKVGRCQGIAGRIQKAYDLSKKYLGQEHDTLKKSRALYYKLLITNKEYKKAIPLVLEKISTLKISEEDNFRKRQYLGQLFSLYGLTNQRALEEQTLIKMLELNKHLLRDAHESNHKIILDLAKNYCLQSKIKKYNDLIKSHDLKYVCLYQ